MSKTILNACLVIYKKLTPQNQNQQKKAGAYVSHFFLVGGQSTSLFVDRLLAQLVVQMGDNTIHCVNVYPVNSTNGFPNTYPLDSAT